MLTELEEKDYCDYCKKPFLNGEEMRIIAYSDGTQVIKAPFHEEDAVQFIVRKMCTFCAKKTWRVSFVRKEHENFGSLSIEVIQ